MSFHLKENKTGYGTMDNESIDFVLLDAGYAIMFDEENNTVNAIEISRPKPLEAASTQKVLYIGDTLDKMVEIYGDDYTVIATKDEEYQIYRYKFMDHYFEVGFQSDVIRSWMILTH